MRSKNKNFDRNEFMERVLARVSREKVIELTLRENGDVTANDLRAFLGNNYEVVGDLKLKIAKKVVV